MTRDEMNDALSKVSDYAQSIGLYGVMILSPRCPDCGQCHGFAMTSDALDVDMVRDLLLRFSDVATDREPDIIEKGDPRGRQ
jgi:hypothetical protein